MALSEKLKTLQQRRIEFETNISKNQTQLKDLSSKLGDLTNRRNALQATVTNLQREKQAIEAAVK